MATAKPKPAGATLYQPYAIETVTSVLSRLPDPDEVLSARGLGRHELRKLETDDEISAALETRREAVVATPWRLDPYEGEAAEWLWEELEPHIESILRGAWTAVPYGFAVQEVVYRKPAAERPRVGIEFVSEKPLEWFEPRRDGTLLYSPPSGGTPHLVDTTAKFLCTRRNPTYRNPFGEALLSRAYWPWFFRHNGWRFWMSVLERFADPLLLGKVYDPSAFVEAMTGLGFSAVVGVGKDEDVSAVTASGAAEFTRVESALIQRIQRLILGQTLTSQVGDSGSYAAAKVHDEVRDDKRRADIRLVTGSVQTVVDALWRLNNLPDEPPTFVLQDDTGLESERAERDASLTSAGVLQFTEQYLLAKYDLEPGDFTLPTALPPVAQAQAPLSAPALLAANGQRFSADQELVEELAGAAIKEAGSPIPAAAIRKAILAASSEVDLVERLAKLYTGTDADAFRELTERALFTADTLGFYAAEKRVGV
jgi:phage gp29-like protein